LRLGGPGTPFMSRGRRKVKQSGKTASKIVCTDKTAPKIDIKEFAKQLGARPPIHLSVIEAYSIEGEKLILELEPGVQLETSEEDSYLVFKGEGQDRDVIFEASEVIRVYVKETGQALWPE